MRLPSDEEIRRRHGRKPMYWTSVGSSFRKVEEAENAFRELWAEVLVVYAHALRRLRLAQ